MPTPGLANHNAQQEKNNEKRRKNNETRQRNAALKLLSAALASTGSDRLPPTPLPAVAARPRVPSTPSNPRPVQRPAHPRAPFVPIVPQPTVPPTFNPVPSPSIRSQSQASLVPPRYQPAYPDYGPRLSSSPPYVRTPARPDPQDDEFVTMAAQMSPEELSRLLSLNTDSTGPGTNNSGAAVEYPRDYNGAYHSDLSYNDSSDGFLEESPAVHDGTRSEDGSGGNDDEENERPWNDDLAGDDPDQEDQEEDIHRNAQSSLDVTMYEVDVQRKRRKRRAPEMETHSDSDDHPPRRRQHASDGNSPARPKQKPRKKRANRRQKSRSIRDIDPGRQSIVMACYPFIQNAVAVRNPWPAASPSGDPSADDDEVERLIDEAWDKALDLLDLPPDEVEARTDNESDLINARISQLRGAVMTAVDVLIPSCYGFTDPQDLKEPTPESIAAVLEANRKLVEDLCGMFMYEDPKQRDDIATICGHRIFQKLLNSAFFAKKGANRRAHYFNGMDLLPTETLALLMDAVVCGIDRWKTGEYDSRSAPFEAKTYAPVHRDSMAFLKMWILEYEADVYPVNLANERLKGMLSKARMLSGAPVEQA